MNEQFFYINFRLRVKCTGTQPVTQVMLEIPRRLVEDWKRENPSHLNSDEAVAADIARVVAVRTTWPKACVHLTTLGRVRPDRS